RMSMIWASRPWPAPRSTTRPPRKRRRARRATSQASYSSLRGRQPAPQTARAMRSKSDPDGNRPRSCGVRRAFDERENATPRALRAQLRRAGLVGGRERLHPLRILAARRRGVLLDTGGQRIERVERAFRRLVLVGLVDGALQRRDPIGRERLAPRQLIQVRARDLEARGPRDLGLLLRVEDVELHGRRGVDLVLR